MKSKNTTGYNFSGMGMGRGPVFEIDQRQQRARRTKDIWEDQKAGGRFQLYLLNKTQ